MTYKQYFTYKGVKIRYLSTHGRKSSMEAKQQLKEYFDELVEEYDKELAYDVAGDLSEYDMYGVAVNGVDYENFRQSYFAATK